MTKMVEAPCRLYWNRGQSELVPEGDPDARTLAASHAGKMIPAGVPIRGYKAAAQVPNKAAPKAPNKAGGKAKGKK